MRRKHIPPDPVKQKLRRLSHEAAKGVPAHFAGRAKLIERVLGHVEELPPEGNPGNTVVFLGAPGAGKTALLRELARRLDREGVATIMRAEVPDSPEGVQETYWDVARGLHGISPDLSHTTVSESVEGSVGLASILSAGGTMASVVSPPRIDSVQSIGRLPGVSGAAFKKKVVVFIDEVQNIEPEGAARKLARDLHTQTTAPVLLVCAGLSNSRRRLEDAKLTRGGHFIPLGPLGPKEAHAAACAAMVRVGKELGIPGSRESMAHVARTIQERSDGWPMHIHNYLRGIWDALASQDAPSFDRLASEKALGKGDEYRKEYYNERITASGAPIKIIRALLRDIARSEKRGQTRLSEHAASVAIRRAVREMPEGDEKEEAREILLPGKVALERMVRAGLVSIDKERRCSSPIPTLSEFVFSAEASDGAPPDEAPESTSEADWGPSP